MKKPEFSSVFAPTIIGFLDYKGQGGFKEESYCLSMKKFDSFLASIGKEDLTFSKEDAELWRCKDDMESQNAYYKRLSVTRQFLLFLYRNGYDVHVFRGVKYPASGFVPHIYSPEECGRYFAALDVIPFTAWQDRLQLPVIFRILYGCGTRATETLSIRKKDVDLEKGIIRLCHTKNNKPRYIAVDESLRLLLNSYAQKVFYRLGVNDFIFERRNGNALNCSKLHEKHVQILKEAGIPFQGGSRGPRVHDWRHTFAVNSLLHMRDSGMDMACGIYFLMTYLGHSNIMGTERYIHLAERISKNLDKDFGAFVTGLFKGGLLYEED